MLNRQQKESEIERMRQEFSQAASIVFAQHSGLTVTQAQELRARLRQAGAQARVAKNTLIAIALGSEVADALGDILTGPTTYAWHPEDPATPAKVLQKFAEEHPKLLLKGGVLENQALDLAGVERLAKMPSRNELVRPACWASCWLRATNWLLSSAGWEPRSPGPSRLMKKNWPRTPPELQVGALDLILDWKHKLRRMENNEREVG